MAEAALRRVARAKHFISTNEEKGSGRRGDEATRRRDESKSGKRS
jgi:hypothetical protein